MTGKIQATANLRDLISHEFIPYACYYSEDTLLTKNGELIQFIKLDDSGGASDDEFRKAVSLAINSSIDPALNSVWIHTCRNRSQAKSFTRGSYHQYIDFLWRNHLPKEIHFVNEIYISVVVDSAQFEPWRIQEYTRSLSKKAEERFRNSQLAEKYNQLNSVVQNIVAKLNKYKPHKLGLYKENGKYYSEHMEFIKSLMGIAEAKMELPLGDLSVSLKPDHIDFNTYTGRFYLEDGAVKRCGSVISFKEIVGITSYALQDLLNSDSEFVISQAVDFAFGNKYLPALKDQLYINSVSADDKFLKSADLLNAQPVNPENFVLQQTDITIIKPTQAELDASIAKVQKNLQELGIISHLEDLNAERGFWANQAGNFSFLKRQTLMKRNDIACFACFGVDKYTSVEDCLFGRPVTFLQTQDDDIFALHFLNNGHGHFLIVGQDEMDRQSFANLISVQAAAASAKIIFYDHFHKYSDFAQALDAEYIEELDLDKIASRLDGQVHVVVINSIKPILDANAHKSFAKFLDYAASKNCIVICCEDYEENCELLLPNFTTSIFFPCYEITDKFADNYDIFEDEKQVIEFISDGNVYMRHGYEEFVIKFNPSEELTRALLEGKGK